MVIQTKIHVPQLRPELVLRPRLIDRLNRGSEGRLILISAPAGYGKTTLVIEWLHSIQTKFAWLSLDEHDNDPRRFIDYLLAALQQIQAGIGQGAEAMLQSPQPPPSEAVLTVLLNDVARLSEPFILILDDYHVIHTPPIHQQLNFLLEHQPPQMHMVVITREDPLLALPRLRARGQLIEIRQDDLRFSTGECADFLQQVMELRLSFDDIRALERRTEGWIAGLQMAALSMHDHEDIPGFIRDFTGSNRFILDYLMDEVFERQTPDLKDFLLKTSILERLSAPLCNLVAETASSQVMLLRLERANLFTIPLEQSRTWYRYHRLFQELLNHRLRLSDIKEAELHIRASQWYEENGSNAEAVWHALAAQDWARAARLIGTVNQTMLKHGEAVTLLTWCERLPREVVFSNRQLCMVHAWAALMTSRFDVAAALLEQAECMAEPGSTFLGEVASAQAFLARSMRDSTRMIEKSRQALALLPEGDQTTRGIIAMNLGLAYWHDGQLAEAESVLLQACDLCSKTGNQFALLTAQLFLVKVCASRGKLHRAAEMAEALIRNGGQNPILLLAHGDLAEIHQEWNHLQKAREHSEQVFALSQRSGNVEFIQASYLRRATLAHALGNDDEAIAALNEADARARDFPAVIRSRGAALGVQIALARNDPQMLAYWESQIHADVDSHSFYRFMGLTRPRLLIARGKKAEASKELETIYKTALRSEWGYGMIVVRILQSLAAQNEENALAFISDALHLGRPENFIRSFVDAGSRIIPILQKAARRGIETRYVGEILAAMGEKVKSTGTGAAESLSEREVEVLRLVMAGLSNREIAAKLFISAGTAKTHIHHLCGKLGVRNRTEAAIKAKELDLV